MENDSKDPKEPSSQSHASSHHHHQKEPKKDNNVVHVCIKSKSPPKLKWDIFSFIFIYSCFELTLSDIFCLLQLP